MAQVLLLSGAGQIIPWGPAPQKRLSCIVVAQVLALYCDLRCCPGGPAPELEGFYNLGSWYIGDVPFGPMQGIALFLVLVALYFIFRPAKSYVKPQESAHA